MFYTHKAIRIEAVQWFPGKDIDGIREQFYMDANDKLVSRAQAYMYIGDIDDNDVVLVEPSDWVVTNDNGERFIVDDGYFNSHYEKIT